MGATRQAKEGHGPRHSTAPPSWTSRTTGWKELEAELAMVRPRPFAHTGWVGHLPEVMSRSGSRRCWDKACWWVQCGSLEGGTWDGLLFRLNHTAFHLPAWGHMWECCETIH